MATATQEKADIGETIIERHWLGDQSWHYERIVKKDGHKIRVKIVRNAYDFQSSAKAERWDGEQWQKVTSDPISACACKKLTYVGKAYLQDFREDFMRLFLTAMKIVA